MQPLIGPAPAPRTRPSADGAACCFVAPGAPPSHPGLNAHLRRMHELRPGLHVHGDDVRDADDLTAQTEMSEGLRIVLLLEGSIDVSYGQRRLPLNSPSGGDSASGVRALMVAVAETELFVRRARRGNYARRVSIGLGPDWLAQTCSAGDTALSRNVQLFMRQHLAMRQWQASPRAVAMAMAEQLARPPRYEPLLQNLYVESRTLELVTEALATLADGTGEPVAAAPAGPALRPNEYRRLRELHEFLGTPQADGMSLDELARHAGTNTNTLQRQFRLLYGTTVFDYLRENRLLRARRALEHDGLSVAQAATLAGYTSAANFATAYKRCFGLSPKQARSRI